MRDEDIVGILGRTCPDRDETACLKNLVERCTVHNKIFDHRKRSTPPRLYSNRGPVLEVPHEKLASRYMIIRTVRTTVNIKGAGTAYTLTAIVIERDRAAALATALDSYRVRTLTDKLLVENIKHLKERSIFLNA